MKEYILHSGVMHYLSSNFSKLYQQDCHLKHNLLNMHFANFYQLLKSNSLRVDDENEVLGFVFNYVLQIESNKVANKVTNLLASALRYNFICLRKILSAIRRNEHLRGSKEFVERLRNEMNYRVGPNN